MTIRLSVCMLMLTVLYVRAGTYDLAFSTYFGGADNWDQARDICVDASGNVYITGGTASSDFPTTPGAYDRSLATGGGTAGSAAPSDIFVAKFNASGQLVWSTYLGGPNYDRGYGIKVDAAGYVYVCGRAGRGFPVTTGAFQTTFMGVNAGIYGDQNGFVAKIKPDGSGLEWCSYVGLASLCRDLDIDASGNVYTHLAYENKGSGTLPASWFTGAFQNTRNGGTENGVIKIAPDGKSVVWATWLGGSGDEQKEGNVRVDTSGNVFVMFQTGSTDIPTPNGYDRTYGGNGDAYLAKLNSTGTSLLFGTYLGVSGMEPGVSTHNLAVDASGNAYISQTVDHSGLPVTAGMTYQGSNDIHIIKFSSSGSLLAGAYVGTGSFEGPDGICADAAGNVYVTGSTNASVFPTTTGAYQSAAGGSEDAILFILDAGFGQLNYSSRMGGGSYDQARSGYWDVSGNLYLTGSSNGGGWPVYNAYQPSFAGGGGGQELCYKGACYAGDVILAKFTPAATGIDPQQPVPTGMKPGSSLYFNCTGQRVDDTTLQPGIYFVRDSKAVRKTVIVR